MSKIAKSFVELIGKTPLLAATRFGAKFGADANIFAKLEYFNPGGSVKDRIAAAIIQAAVESGELNASDILAELADDAEKAQDTNPTIKTETPVSRDELPEEVQAGIEEGEAADAARPE